MGNIRIVNIPRNQICEIHGRILRFERQSSTTRYFEFFDIERDTHVSYSLDDILAWMSTGDFNAYEGVPATSGSAIAYSIEALYDPARLAEANRRTRYCLAWERCGDNRITRKLLKPIIKAVHESEPPGSQAPGVSSFQRWLKKWRDHGRTALAVAPKMRVGNRKTLRLNPKVKKVFVDTLYDAYLTTRRLPVTLAYGAASSRIKKEFAEEIAEGRIKIPSLQTAYREIGKIAPYEVMAAREGKRAADRIFAPKGKTTEAIRHNDIWEIDHTTANFIVVCEQTGGPIGRPTITVIIDRHTRMIVGISISFHGSGFAAMYEALRHAILPKNKTLDELRAAGVEIEGDWPCQGKPRLLVSDQGAEFISESFISGCTTLGIDLDPTKPYTPDWKPHIESWFATVEEGFCNYLPGSTFGDFYKRIREVPPEKTACISLTEFRWRLIKWIVDVYSLTEHRTLKMSPRRALQNSLDIHGLDLVPGRRLLDAALTISHWVTLHDYGIEYENLRYQSEEVGLLMSRLGKAARVEIRVNVANLGSILVVDPNAHLPLSVPVERSMRDIAEGRSLAQHKRAQALIRHRHPDDKLAISKIEAYRRTYEMIEDALPQALRHKKKEVRRVAAQFKYGPKIDTPDEDSAPISQRLLESQNHPATESTLPVLPTDQPQAPVEAPYEPEIVVIIPKDEDDLDWDKINESLGITTHFKDEKGGDDGH